MTLSPTINNADKGINKDNNPITATGIKQVDYNLNKETLMGEYPAPGDNVNKIIRDAKNRYPGDKNFSILNNQSNDTLWGERGIELFENFGFDETFRVAENYSSALDKGVDTVSRFINYRVLTGFSLQNWGRKVCLYGNIEYSLFSLRPTTRANSFSNYATNTWDNDKTSYRDARTGYIYASNLYPAVPMDCATFDGSRELCSVSEIIASTPSDINFDMNRLFVSGWVIRIKFDAQSINPDDIYKYFGNSGIEIHSTYGKKYRFTSKNTDFNKTRIITFNNRRYYLTFFSQATNTLWIDATFWYIFPLVSGGVFSPPSNYYPSDKPTLFNFVPGDELGRKLVNRGNSLLTPAPVAPVSHCYDGTQHYIPFDHIGFSATPMEPCSSGYKSIYIPPHMEIQGYSQAIYYAVQWMGYWNIMDTKDYRDFEDKSQVWGDTLANVRLERAYMIENNDKYKIVNPNFYSIRETYIGSKDNGNNHSTNEVYTPLPIRFDNSLDQNGAFYSLGTNVPNSMLKYAQKDSVNNEWIKSKADCDWVPQKNISECGGIYSGCLLGIKVAVSTTKTFDRYMLGKKDGVPGYFCPEIFLVPGCSEGAQYIIKTQKKVESKATIYYDAFQSIIDPPDFWTDKNPYYADKINGNTEYNPGPPRVILNTNFKAFEVLPDPPVIKANTLVSLAIINPTKRFLNLDVAPMLSDPKRITSFDIIDGIYSIEWLYALYNCAIKCQMKPFFSNDKVIHTQKATYPGGPVSCCTECSLFRDTSIGINFSNAVYSDSDYFMSCYAGLRNLTYAYAYTMSLDNVNINNECNCLVAVGFCPGMMVTGCSTPSPSQQTQYEYMLTTQQQSNCTNAQIENYCNMVSIQIYTSTQGGTTEGGGNIDSITGCSGTGNQDPVSSGDPPAGDPPAGSTLPPVVGLPPEEGNPPPGGKPPIADGDTTGGGKGTSIEQPDGTGTPVKTSTDETIPDVLGVGSDNNLSGGDTSTTTASSTKIYIYVMMFILIIFTVIVFSLIIKKKISK